MSESIKLENKAKRFHFSMLMENYGEFKYILENYMDELIEYNSFEYAAQLMASMGRLDFLKLILENEHCSNLVDLETVLERGAQTNSYPIVKYLLKDKKMAISVHNKALVYSIENCNFDSVKLLVEDRQIFLTHTGDQPIREAFRQKDIKILHYLWKQEGIQDSLKLRKPAFYDIVQRFILQNTIKDF